MKDLVLATAADAAAALEHATGQVRAGEIAQCLAVAALCDLHQVDETILVEGAERWIPGGADGTPQIGEFIVAEIAGLLGVSLGSARLLVERVLNLRHRHPTLWQLMIEGDIRAFEAFKVADTTTTARLSSEACARFDALCAQALALQPWARVRRDVERWILLADPEQAALNQEAAAERRYVHVGTIERGHVGVWGQLDTTDGIALDDALTQLADHVVGDTIDHRGANALGVLARHALGQTPLPTCTSGAGDPGADDAATDETGTDAGVTAGSDPGVPRRRKADLIITLTAADLACPETGVASLDRWGHLLLPNLRDLLAGYQIRVRPIISENDLPPVDSYQVPDNMRVAVETRNPVDVFPWGTRPARSCQQDHTIPYDHTRTEGTGQTRPDNLAPLSVLAHRIKTHGGWHLEQPQPGVLVWRSPLGYEYHVTAAGTIRIGRPPPPEHAWWLQEPPQPRRRGRRASAWGVHRPSLPHRSTTRPRTPTNTPPLHRITPAAGGGPPHAPNP